MKPREPRARLKSGRELSLRGARSDEASSFSGKDCFAEFILSVVEGLAKTRFPDLLRQPLRVLVSQWWFAVRLGVWLCVLPIFLRVYTLPALLHHLTKVPRHPPSRNPLELDRAVGIAMRLCQLRLFRLSLFPQACLRQALTLYHVLTRMGYPVAIHFGVQKEGEALHGHSWVTLQGKPVAERTPTTIFKTVYSYPSPLFRAALDEPKVNSGR